MAKQRQRRPVAPVQVIEDQQQQFLFTRLLQQARHGGVHQIALCLGIALTWSGQIGNAIAEGGYEASQVAAETLDVGVEDRLSCFLNEVSKRLYPRLVRDAEVLIRAP